MAWRVAKPAEYIQLNIYGWKSIQKRNLYRLSISYNQIKILIE